MEPNIIQIEKELVENVELLHFINDLNAEKMNVKVLINYMYDPTFLKVEILNKEERNKVLDYYKSVNFNNKDIINVLKTGDDYTNYREKYVSYTNSLDKLWNKNIKVYIPELSSLSH